MSDHPYASSRVDRRIFMKSALLPAALPIASMVAESMVQSAEPPADAPAGPEIIDTNVHLFKWPFRDLKYDTTDALVAKLRKHRITQVWAGSFEAVLHKQLDRSNSKLAEECQARGAGMLVPIGTVNPAWPDWEEDLRPCVEQYRMPGIRLYPSYHGYSLDHPEFARLLDAAVKHSLLVQIALRLEDERVQHQALNVPPVDVAPLADVLNKVPRARLQLINAPGLLLGNHVTSLVENTVSFDIAAIESNGGVGRVIEGKNTSFFGSIPIDRLLFGSHAPFFPCEAAVFKLFESPLNREQLGKIMNENAKALIA